MTKIHSAFVKDIPRFALTFGATAVVFHLILCVFKRLGKRKGQKWFLKMTDKKVCTIAAFFATLPLAIGLQPNEINVLKMLFFPMMFRCIFDTLLAQQIVLKLEFGSVLAYMLVTFIAAYTGGLETHSCPDSMTKMMKNYSKLDRYEQRSIYAVSLTNKRDLGYKYNLTH